MTTTCASSFTSFSPNSRPVSSFQSAHVEILFAHAVQRSGQVGIAVSQRAAARSHGRGGSNVALFGDEFCVVYGQGFNPAAAPVAEAAPLEDADGVPSLSN